MKKQEKSFWFFWSSAFLILVFFFLLSLHPFERSVSNLQSEAYYSQADFLDPLPEQKVQVGIPDPGQKEPGKITAEDQGINVAAYYLTGWGVKNDFPRSQDLSIGSELYPVLGTSRPVDEAGSYDSGDPAIAEQHIEWANRYGVDTFVVPYMYPGWEWEKNLESGLLQARNLEEINFIIQYDATPHLRCDGVGKKDCDPFVNLIEKTATTVSYIASEYFDHPSYLRLQNKPTLFVYHAHVLYDKLGRKRFNSFLEELRGQVPGAVYLVGDLVNADWFSFKENVFLTRRFEAVTSYNMPTLGKGYSRNENNKLSVVAPYSTLVDGYIEQAERWSQFASSLNRSFIPPLLTGFSNRTMYDSGYDDWLVQRYNYNAEEFARMAWGVKRFIDPQLGLVVVGAWNEFQEGAVLEPTFEFGFSYLEIVKEVFGD